MQQRSASASRSHQLAPPHLRRFVSGQEQQIFLPDLPSCGPAALLEVPFALAPSVALSGINWVDPRGRGGRRSGCGGGGDKGGYSLLGPLPPRPSFRGASHSQPGAQLASSECGVGVGGRPRRSSWDRQRVDSLKSQVLVEIPRSS